MEQRRQGFLMVILAMLSVFFVANILKILQPREVKNIFPTIKISLNDTDIEEIYNGTKQTKYAGNDLILSLDGKDITFNEITIKGRGNSTWGTLKKPFQIEFAKKVDLFGMGKAKKWIFLANRFDATNLRNDTAFYVGRMLDEKYALQGEFVHLDLDGHDLGLYYVTPKIEIDKSRVDLKDRLGVLVELDNLHNMDDIDKECHRSYVGNCMLIQDAVAHDYEVEAMRDFMKSFNKLEMAAEAGDYEKVKSVADTADLAKYYLISEFTVNPDAYVSSYFFFKDGEKDLIHAGPAWDFDFALGNREWCWSLNDDFYSPSITQVQESYAWGGQFYNHATGEMTYVEPDTKISRLIYWLMKIPEFRKEVVNIFRTKMAGRSDELIGYITRRASLTFEEAIHDNELWGRTNYDTELTGFINWVRDRFSHFEDTYNESFYAIIEE